jgi:hypothetical protein
VADQASIRLFVDLTACRQIDPAENIPILLKNIGPGFLASEDAR